MSDEPMITVAVTLKRRDFEELTALYHDPAVATGIMAKLVDSFLAHRAWLKAYEADQLSLREAHMRILETIEALLPEG